MAIRMPVRNEDGTTGVRESYVGCVLETRERNYRDDSDFYAVVWDVERGAPTTVEYDTTRFGGGGNAVVDATPEVIAAYNAYREARYAEARAAREKLDAAIPKKGSMVEVIRDVRGKHGKRVTVGATYEVGWFGTDSYSYSRYSGRCSGWRVGLKIPGERDFAFLNANAVRVVGAEMNAHEAASDLATRNYVAGVAGAHGINAYL